MVVPKQLRCYGWLYDPEEKKELLHSLGSEYAWWVYPEAGTYAVSGQMLENATGPVVTVHIPPDLGDREFHVLVTVRDHGTPPLARYRRVIIAGANSKASER